METVINMVHSHHGCATVLLKRTGPAAAKGSIRSSKHALMRTDTGEYVQPSAGSPLRVLCPDCGERVVRFADLKATQQEGEG